MSPKNQSTSIPYFFISILLLISYLLWMVTETLLEPLIFAAILSGIFYPTFNHLESLPKFSRKGAAIVTCLLIMTLVLLPLTFMIISLSKEAIDLYQIIVNALEEKQVHDFFFGEGPVASFLTKVNDIFGINIDLFTIKEKLLESAKGASGILLKSFNKILGNVFHFLLNIALMMLIIFSFFYDGSKLKEFIFHLSPMSDDHEQRIMDKFNQMNFVTIVCNIIGGIIQGGLSGIIIYFAGIHSAFLWTVIMMILAFIPIVGVSLVTLPCSLYLFLKGHHLLAIWVFTSTSTISLIVEKWFKPKFIGKRIQINSTIILLTIVGGMNVFGIAGIFYGPLIAIIFLTVLEIYKENYMHRIQ